MLKNLISYIWNVSADVSLEDAYETLKPEEVDNKVEVEGEEDNRDYTCYYKTGIVTSVNGNQIIIDKLYPYNEPDLNIAVGTKVSFICYTVQNSVQVCNVSIVDNEWNCVESDGKSNWCHRTLIGKVIKREKRNILIDPGNITVNLNVINSEFVPVIGDFVELDVKSEIDENVTDLFGKILDIDKINPLRHKVIQGTVKTWDSVSQSGTINFNVFFNRESLCAGYIPNIKDNIIAEVIESEQGRCSWRALKVILGSNMKNPELLNTFVPQYDIDNLNIKISEDIYVEFTKINDVTMFKFEITNLSSNVIYLNEIKIENVSHQCKIYNCLPITINSDAVVIISGECIMKTVGFSKELIIFIFDICKIGRWIEVSLAPSHKNTNQNNASYYSKKMLTSHAKTFMQDTQDMVIKGPKPYVPARFVKYKLPDYRVPTKLWDVILNFDNDSVGIDELKTIKPVLNQVLSFHNYEDRFHTLLHLEEINSIIEIRRFDRDQVCFIPNGEYLMLEYGNLSEQRPSIIAGDTILAKDTFSGCNISLEGCVYKVGPKHVYLKFTQKFHESYKGEDYAVTVVASRTQVRRMHQAVGFAVKNLGRKFLFPTQVTMSDPQINFYYDKYEDIPNDNLNKKVKRLSNRELMKIVRDKNKATEEESGATLGRYNESEHIHQKSKVNLNYINHNVHKSVSNKATLKLEWFDKSLNYYQKEAVRHILLGEARPLPYFIFGPPGTGKTVTLVETILQILRMAPSRILVAAPSNSAVNLLCIRLIKSGVLKPGDLVRLVSYKAISDDSIPSILAPYCVTASVGIEGTGSSTSTVTESGLTIGCNSKIIGKHRITVGTCSSLGALYSLAFSRGQFTHILVDEAGQATEPEIMIPLSFLDVTSGQCILAGDPMQLGPVVCSKFATEFGLRESFMDRLLNRFPYTRDIDGFPQTGGYDPRLVTKLLYNYRSLPGVLALPNSMFYFSELRPTISADDSEQAQLLFKFKEFLPKGDGNKPPPFVFHGVDGENYQAMDSPSWYNPHEISQVFYYVNELYRAGCTAEDIGIITPYCKQTKDIRSVLTEAEFDVPKVGTVEEFQGQEFNVIILSTVRSNKNMLECDKLHNLGFVTQPKRVNVALTRAQVLTIVVGNPHLLVNDSTWRYIIQYSVKNSAYCGCDISV